MKNLVWLTAALLWQGLSVMAAGKDVALQPNMTYVSQTIYSGFDTARQTRYNTDVLQSLRFNSLTIKTIDRGTLLSWEVEETSNLQYFLIEQAMDGQNFSPLFEVPVQFNQHSYSFVDTSSNKTSDKTIFYRVKAIYPTEVLESPVRKLTAQTN
jgi:hypothetical protein